MTARKLLWMHEGLATCGELASVLGRIFGDGKPPGKRSTRNLKGFFG